MNDDQRKAAFRMRRETKRATALAVVTRLSGYACAAGAVACFFSSYFLQSIALAFVGCFIVAGGAAGAELMDQKTRKAKNAAAREAEAEKRRRAGH